MEKHRIILVEDEQDMADLICMQLQREHYDVQLAHDGLEGLRKIRSHPPDLVLLDLMLPKMSGAEVIKEVRKDAKLTHIPIIMLTAKSEETDVVVGLQLGADDYITKPFSMPVLLARVVAVLRRSQRETPQQGEILTAGPIRIDLSYHTVEVNETPVTLTLTEFRLLAALIGARGRVLTRNLLIDKVMGANAIVTDRTIDVHMTSLRRKLGAARRFIQTVRGVGYRLAEEPAPC